MATRELIIDSFAGGGGASLGIAWALNRSPDVAINHEPKAIAMHATNHPETHHVTEDVFRADPRKVTKGQPVGLLWASPDCTHHSRAKGGKPVKKEVRGLAWAVIMWAGKVSPRVIILENVREFEQWGPVCHVWACDECSWKGTSGQAKLGRRKKGQCPECSSGTVHATKDTVPNPAKKGFTFRMFVGRLRGLGYKVEWRSLNAADYGAPTHRHRLFLVARRDGQPIVWPEPSHGNPAVIGKDLFSGDLKPWRTAAECIDWTLPCPSIFMTRAEAKRWARENKCGVPQRPLKENTHKRVARGVHKLVLNNPRPFLVPFVMVNTTGNPATSADEPVKTVTTGGHHYLVQPVVRAAEPDVWFRHVCTTEAGDFNRESRSGRRCRVCGQKPVREVNQPELPVLAPTVLKFRGDAGASGLNPESPLPTITAGSGKRPAGAGHALGVCAPVLVPVTHAGERRPNDPREPLPTVTAANRGEIAVISPTLMPHYGKSVSASVEAPLPTVVASGMGKQVLLTPVLAHLAHGEGSDGRGRGQRVSSVEAPANTVHAGGNNFALVAPVLVQSGYGEREGQAPRSLDIESPLGTVVAGGAKHALVAAFLAKHYGGVVGHEVDRPLGTVTAVDHHSVAVANLVTLNNNTGPSVPGEPTRTVAAGGNHAALVYSFLTQYNGTATGAPPDAPLNTQSTKDRFGVVTVVIDGREYVIVDIGMRMLTPRELARAQGFPDDYILCPADLERARRAGNLATVPAPAIKWGSKSDQVERIGNSVSPYPAMAVVRANCSDMAAVARTAA